MMYLRNLNNRKVDISKLSDTTMQHKLIQDKVVFHLKKI